MTTRRDDLRNIEDVLDETEGPYRCVCKCGQEAGHCYCAPGGMSPVCEPCDGSGLDAEEYLAAPGGHYDTPPKCGACGGKGVRP